MTSVEPIVIDDETKIEEDIYGEQPKSESPDPETSLKKKVQNGGKYLHARPSQRRHPENADTEDRVLMSMVDEGWDWSDIATQFPGIPLQTLKQRYRNMKAKTMEWSSEDDRKLIKFIREYEEEKWKVVAGKMGLSVKACQLRAKALSSKKTW